MVRRECDDALKQAAINTKAVKVLEESLRSEKSQHDRALSTAKATAEAEAAHLAEL